MCDVNPELKTDIIIENGKRILYMRILKALYDCIESSLLWYRYFSQKLCKPVFKINPYDKCIANKVINGHQCTIAWYANAIQITHTKQQVVTDIINEIKDAFGNLKVTTRGNNHTFLDMQFGMRKDKTMAIKMIGYIKEAIDSFTE